jgi:4-hydroxythreonine-4-phosphate dehydrogenase
MTMAALPTVGLMLGDPTGIGAEIVCKVVAAGELPVEARWVVVGDARHLDLGMRDAGVRIDWRGWPSLERIDWSDRALPLVDLANIDPAGVERGAASAEAGRLSGETLAFMIGEGQAGRLDGICFAPLNKGALFRGGWKYHDEHQMFADLTGHRGYYGEMNSIEPFSTFRVTSHIALREVTQWLTAERLDAALDLAHTSMQGIEVERPRIAVAALNPHGGEGGLFGDEELTLIGPAVERARARGIDARGPFPSDTLFLKARAGQFDAVLTMYHDQGQIATKLLGFGQGVTITAGLPTVFTTPAHGVAYDIVGQGRADPGAMRSAMRRAAQLAAAAVRRRARQAARTDPHHQESRP